MINKPQIRKTKAFQSFEFNHDQVVLLANLVGVAGTDRALDKLAEASTLTQRVAGLDIQEFMALSEEERNRLGKNATPAENEAMQDLVTEAERLAGMG